MAVSAITDEKKDEYLAPGAYHASLRPIRVSDKDLDAGVPPIDPKLREDWAQIGNMALVFLADEGVPNSLQPFKVPDANADFFEDGRLDMAERAIRGFRANIFFRNYQPDGPADYTLIYGMLYISQLLSLLKPSTTEGEAKRLFEAVFFDRNPPIPGEARFPKNLTFAEVTNKADTDLLKSYLTVLRTQIARKLLRLVYQDGPNAPSKHWLALAKRRFMGQTL